MGQPRAFEPEKLLVAVLSAQGLARPPVITALEQRFGPSDLVSAELPFGFTHYYDAEMGPGIRRWFFSARKPIAPEQLAAVKLTTTELEAQFSEGGRRRVNLDPGLLGTGRLVLASTKPGPHRIPLAQGIYAELTLVYERGAFRPLRWTYPDFRSPEYLAVLDEVRRLFMRQRRDRRAARDSQTRSLPPAADGRGEI